MKQYTNQERFDALNRHRNSLSVDNNGFFSTIPLDLLNKSIDNENENLQKLYDIKRNEQELEKSYTKLNNRML